MIGSLDHRYFPLVLDVLDQGVFTVDENTLITYFNHAAEAITGYRAEEVIGKRCSQIFRTELCGTVCPLLSSIRSRTAIRNRQVHIQNRQGQAVAISISTAPLVTEGGELLGGVEVFRDLSAMIKMQRMLDSRYRLVDIIGKSPVMRRIFDMLPLVAESDSTVLVSGASGTGKELLARTIHALGPRRRGPFVPVNCAAIPETLLEAELFGHRKGAFTDAKRDRPGRIAAAEGGTLFLDEIGELPRSMQVKVLRFLQERKYEPLGFDQSIDANVRVVTATNRDLARMVQEKEFREDLYFRINVVQIQIPPLSERPEDIPLLVEHFVKMYREKTGRAITGLSEAAMAVLMSYHFPGNVRELENIIERAFILCQGSRIEPDHFSLDLSGRSLLARDFGRQAAEAAAIREALARSGGNRSRAARELGVHRITLLRRMKRLGMG